jgi:hypothetical protein
MESGRQLGVFPDSTGWGVRPKRSTPERRRAPEGRRVKVKGIVVPASDHTGRAEEENPVIRQNHRAKVENLQRKGPSGQRKSLGQDLCYQESSAHDPPTGQFG